MATNYFKNIYDEIVELISANSNFSHLTDKHKPFLRDKLMPKDFAYEDGIMLTPLTDELIEPRVPGREDQYDIQLTYFRKMEPEIDYDILTKQAENLIELFRDHQTLGPEILDETDFATHAKWDTDGRADDSGGNCEWTFTDNAINGKCWQDPENRVLKGKDSTTYRFTYTIAVTTAPDNGTDNFYISTWFAASATTLKETAGTYSVDFTSHASASSRRFQIQAINNSPPPTQGQFTIDDVSLKEVINQWHYIAAQTVDYTIEVPDEMIDKNYYGFTMRVIIFKGKYD